VSYPQGTIHRVKRCKKCGIVKPFEEFYREKGCRDGYRPECKVCNLAARKAWYAANREREIARVKAWQQANPDRVNASQRARHLANPNRAREGHLRRKFGLSLEDYDQLLATQGGVCGICLEPPRPGESFHVDHHDERDGVRGILCVRCNNALGQLREDIAIAERAVDYLASNGFVPSGTYADQALAVARAKGLVGVSG
jgi:hypothetical protein